MWLRDSHRPPFYHEGKIHLVDTRSKKVREVVSVAPYEVEEQFTLSKDDRLIVFLTVVAEADIWMILNPAVAALRIPMLHDAATTYNAVPYHPTGEVRSSWNYNRMRRYRDMAMTNCRI